MEACSDVAMGMWIDINKIPGDARRRKDPITKYAREHGLVFPKMLRKINWRILIRAIDKDVPRFIQSRFGELSISEAAYENLLEKADQEYPRALEELRKSMVMIYV